MARSTPSAIRQGPDFQKTYMWQVQILRQPSLANIDEVRFDRQMMSTDVPHWTGDTAQLDMRGYKIPDPGIYAPAGPLSLTFVETVDAVIRTWLMTWALAMKNKSGYFSALSADFRLISMDNQENTNFAYDMLYCFLEDSTIDQLTGGDSTPMQPQLQLVYTDFDFYTSF